MYVMCVTPKPPGDKNEYVYGLYIIRYKYYTSHT